MGQGQTGSTSLTIIQRQVGLLLATSGRQMVIVDSDEALPLDDEAHQVIGCQRVSATPDLLFIRSNLSSLRLVAMCRDDDVVKAYAFGYQDTPSVRKIIQTIANEYMALEIEYKFSHTLAGFESASHRNEIFCETLRFYLKSDNPISEIQDYLEKAHQQWLVSHPFVPIVETREVEQKRKEAPVNATASAALSAEEMTDEAIDTISDETRKLLVYTNQVHQLMCLLTTLLMTLSEEMPALPLGPDVSRSLCRMDRQYVAWLEKLIDSQAFSEIEDTIELVFSRLKDDIYMRARLLNSVLEELHSRQDVQHLIRSLQFSMLGIMQGEAAPLLMPTRYSVWPVRCKNQLDLLIEFIDDELCLESSDIDIDVGSPLFHTIDYLSQLASQCRLLADACDLYPLVLSRFQSSYSLLAGKYGKQSYQVITLLNDYAQDFLRVRDPFTLSEDKEIRSILKERPVITRAIWLAAIENFLHHKTPWRVLFFRVKEKTMLEQGIVEQLSAQKRCLIHVNVQPANVAEGELFQSSSLHHIDQGMQSVYGSRHGEAPPDVILINIAGEESRGKLIIMLRSEGVYQITAINFEVNDEDNDQIRRFVLTHYAGSHIGPVIDRQVSFQLGIDDWARRLAQWLLKDKCSVPILHAYLDGAEDAALDTRLQQALHEKEAHKSNYEYLYEVCEDLEKEVLELQADLTRLRGERDRLVRQQNRMKRQSSVLMRDQSMRVEINVIQQYEETIRSLRDEVDGLTDQVSRMSREGEELVEAEQAARDESERLTKHLSEMQIALQSAKDQLRIASEENQRLALLEDERERLVSEVQGLSDQLDIEMAKVTERRRLDEVEAPLSLAEELAEIGESLTHEAGEDVAKVLELQNQQKHRLVNLESLVKLSRVLNVFQQYIADAVVLPIIEAEKEQISLERLNRYKTQSQARGFFSRLMNDEVEVDYHDLNERQAALVSKEELLLKQLQKFSGQLSAVLTPLLSLVSDFAQNKVFNEPSYGAVAADIVKLIKDQLPEVESIFNDGIFKDVKGVASSLRINSLKMLWDDFVSSRRQMPTMLATLQLEGGEVADAAVYSDEKLLEIIDQCLAQFQAQAVWSGVLKEVDSTADWAVYMRHIERGLDAMKFIGELQRDEAQKPSRPDINEQLLAIASKYDLAQQLELDAHKGEREDASSVEGVGKNRESMRRGTAVAGRSNFVKGHASTFHQFQMMIYLWFAGLNRFESNPLDETSLQQASQMIDAFMRTYEGYLGRLYDAHVTTDLAAKIEALQSEGGVLSESASADAMEAMQRAAEQKRALNESLQAKAHEIIESQKPALLAYLKNGLSLFPSYSRVLEANQASLQAYNPAVSHASSSV